MTTTTDLPEKVQTIIDRWAMTEEPEPNPTPRPGNRPIHTTAIRLWTGGRNTVDGAYADDGYDWMAMADASGWPASPRYGDWPMVVECLKSFQHNNEPHRPFRFTYLEGSVYLAEYPDNATMLADAWKNEV